MSNIKNNVQEKLIRKAWEDADFKKKLLENPKEVIQNTLELSIPDDIQIIVVEETPNTMYLVLPANPVTTDNLIYDTEENDITVQSYIP